MQKYAKRVNTHSAGDSGVTGTINISRSYGHVWDPEFVPILLDYFILLSLCKAVRFPSQLRVSFDRRRLIQQSRPRFVWVGIHAKLTNVDKTFQEIPLQAGVK